MEKIYVIKRMVDNKLFIWRWPYGEDNWTDDFKLATKFGKEDAEKHVNDLFDEPIYFKGYLVIERYYRPDYYDW